MRTKFKLASILFTLLIVSLACGSEVPAQTPGVTALPVSSGPPRSFHLGFTPAPHDFTPEAILYTYAQIGQIADIIAHHFDDGIPWPEALAGTPYNAKLREDWEFRRSQTPAGHKIYVAITPLNFARNGLADYRAAEGNLPLPAPWDGYSFNHDDVKTAFLNHAINTVEFFDPDYLAIGIEANLLINSNPEKWDAYMELHKFVYTVLKQIYPDLPIMVSLFGTSLVEGFIPDEDHSAHLDAFNDIISYSDFFAVSLYPFISWGRSENIPESMYTDLFSLSDKPIVIAETGYPAESFSILDGAVTFDSDPQKQLAYFESLLAEADELDFVFIINFFMRDYDILWNQLKESDLKNLANIWRDSGFIDENGGNRPVLDLWLHTLARPLED